MYPDRPMIPGEHALYVDVNCMRCNKLMAMSYGFPYKTGYLCEHCVNTLWPTIEAIKKSGEKLSHLEDENEWPS